MNKNLLTAAIGAALAVAGTSAHAIEGKFSGQVNRAVMMADDGLVSETHHVDNDTSSSRFRFTGSAEMLPGVKAGLVWEMGYQSNSSSKVTQAVRTSNPTLDERHQHVYFEGAFGNVSLGQGDGAANGGIEVDLSGTSVINYAGVTDIGGALAFRNGAGALTGATIANTTSQQDFESRYDRLRYDTPSFGGFKLSGSTGQKSERNVKEAALWYSGNLGEAGKLAGAVGFSKEDTAHIGADNETTGGSISWLAPFGLNVTLAYSAQEIITGATTTRDGKFTYVKVGYKAGQHAVAVDMAKADEQGALDDEAGMIGVGYVFSPKSWAELYAGYKIHSLDRLNTTTEDISILTVGSRLKF
jgi:predicted porin